jgi:hypothetical protein
MRAKVGVEEEDVVVSLFGCLNNDNIDCAINNPATAHFGIV